MNIEDRKLKRFVGDIEDCRDCPYCVFRGHYARCRAVEKWIPLDQYWIPQIRKDCPLPDKTLSIPDQTNNNNQYEKKLTNYLLSRYYNVLTEKNIDDLITYINHLNNLFSIELVL